MKAMETQKYDVGRRNFISVRKKLVDNMEAKTPWRFLDKSLLVDVPKEPGKEIIEPGVNSQEKIKQTLREQSILQVIYFTRNMVPDSPDEPDQVEIFPFFEPLNIPLEDMAEDTEPIYNGINSYQQTSVVEIPNKTNILPLPNMMMQQSQFPVYADNQMNWSMPPEKMIKMGPPPNNMFIPPNSMMMNNQMYMGNQMPQHPQALPLQQQQPAPQHYQPSIQEDQWMGSPGPLLQHWSAQQPPPNYTPPYFARGGGQCHIRQENFRSGNYEPYQGKMNRINQWVNRGGPYNRRGNYSGNGGRLCKYYAKEGCCKILNCAFLHSRS